MRPKLYSCTRVAYLDTPSGLTYDNVLYPTVISDKAITMAVPKRRTSHARQGKRRSHQHVKPLQIQYCSRCNEPVLPHRVCPNCGHYQGREVVVMEEEK